MPMRLLVFYLKNLCKNLI